MKLHHPLVISLGKLFIYNDLCFFLISECVSPLLHAIINVSYDKKTKTHRENLL
jgi:hypothetical protein